MTNPPHPGEIIREVVLAELDLTVEETALRLGVSRVTLNRVVNGQAGISPDLAIRLELAGTGTARGWLAMQVNYEIARELDGKIYYVKPLDAA